MVFPRTGGSLMSTGGKLPCYSDVVKKIDPPKEKIGDDRDLFSQNLGLYQ